jgi:uncharacterized protein YjiS (DUF1127 family)
MFAAVLNECASRLQSIRVNLATRDALARLNDRLLIDANLDRNELTAALETTPVWEPLHLTRAGMARDLPPAMGLPRAAFANLVAA